MCTSQTYTSETVPTNQSTGPPSSPVPNPPQEAFALVVQLSHAAGDGATYYQLMQMLCSIGIDKDSDEDPTIVDLIPDRIQESKQMQIGIMGETEENHFTSFGFKLNLKFGFILNEVQGYLPFEYSLIDLQNFLRERSGLTVRFYQCCPHILHHVKFRPHGMMAINWRNRLRGHTERHAGDYENLIYYIEEDYA